MGRADRDVGEHGLSVPGDLDPLRGNFSVGREGGVEGVVARDEETEEGLEGGGGGERVGEGRGGAVLVTVVLYLLERGGSPGGFGGRLLGLERETVIFGALETETVDCVGSVIDLLIGLGGLGGG